MNENDGIFQMHPSEIEKFQLIMDDLNKRCHERFRVQCELFGVNEAELRCLRLFENQRYMTSKDISSALGVVRSRVSKIVDGLEKKGLLRRTPDPDDSRVALVSLTASGRERWETVREHVRGVNASILGRLSEAQRGELLSALAMLKVSMDAVSPLGAEGRPSGGDGDFFSTT